MHQRGRRRHGIRGFTLIELLIVMVLIGLITSLAVVTIGGGKEEALKTEAQRIQALLRVASDEAILNARPIGARFERDGYMFLRLEEDEWIPLDNDRSLRSRELPEFVELRLLVEEETAERDAESEDEEDGEEKAPPPQVLFLGTGEATAFELQIGSPDIEQSYLLTGDVDGSLELQTQ